MESACATPGSGSLEPRWMAAVWPGVAEQRDPDITSLPKQRSNVKTLLHSDAGAGATHRLSTIPLSHVLADGDISTALTSLRMS